ncbi:hypothetical protein GALL_208750 [mine drainage metagenome]|uniref:Uncharacterized protein n=1 Tax=mine drainage metagenome TaxID=410659 RepID=A0A1J5RZ22_9ZZZZ
MNRSVLGAALALLVAAAPLSAALAEDMPTPPPPRGARHCPDNPAGTYRFFEKSGQTEQDKARLEQLAPLARQQSFLCILAFDNPAQWQTRRMAVRRVKWVMDILTGNGVPRSIIGIEFRPAQLDPEAMRQVQVILGR